MSSRPYSRLRSLYTLEGPSVSAPQAPPPLIIIMVLMCRYSERYCRDSSQVATHGVPAIAPDGFFAGVYGDECVCVPVSVHVCVSTVSWCGTMRISGLLQGPTSDLYFTACVCEWVFDPVILQEHRVGKDRA